MKRSKSRGKHKQDLPLITIIMSAAALVIVACQNVVPFLQYDRTAIANGEIWRIITSHLTHWSFDHFLWCTVTFFALGSICERLSRKGYLGTLAVSILFIPAVMWLADPKMIYYRGLSGIASGVFVFGAAMMMQKALLRRDWLEFNLAGVAGFAFIAKILFEYISGQTFFVNSQQLFNPAPLVHLAGGLVGLVMFFMFMEKRRKPAMDLQNKNTACIQ